MSFHVDTRRGYDPPPPQDNGLGLAGFIISLVGFLTCGCISPLGLLLSIVGACFPPRGFAIAGLVLGTIGSAWLWLFGFAIVAGFAGLDAAGKKLIEEEKQRQAAKQHPVKPRPVEPEPQPPVIRFRGPPAPRPEPEPERPEPIKPVRSAAPLRTWTFKDGSTTYGRFKGVAFGNVRIEKEDGAISTVPIETLSREDRDWIAGRK